MYNLTTLLEMSRLPNRATLVALCIIGGRQEQMGEQAFATWVEIYKGVQPYDMTGEQMQRALHKGTEKK